MLERECVQHRGFRNVEKDGKIIGFQVAVRQLGYRGTWLSELRSEGLIVDGVKYSGDQVTWTIGGRDYTEKEMASLGRVFWPLNETAILMVEKPGGLSQGEHEVSIVFGHISSYSPPRTDEMAASFEMMFHMEESKPRKLLIV